MKAYNFILSKRFLDRSLADDDFYFRIEFENIIKLTKSLNEEEFFASVHSSVSSFNIDIQKIVNTFVNAELNVYIQDKSKFWQNSEGHLIMSKEGIIHGVNDSEKLKSDLFELKKTLLQEGIFIKISDYGN